MIMRKIALLSALWQIVGIKKAHLIKTGFFVIFFLIFHVKKSVSWGMVNFEKS